MLIRVPCLHYFKELVMAQKSWQVVKVQFCDRTGCDVAYEVQVVHPPDIMPDQPPRIQARRCSHADQCTMADHPGCFWSGTNPLFDPFAGSD